MKSIIRMMAVLGLVSLAVAGSPALAQDASGIVVINIQQIMKDSAAAKSARDQITQRQKAFLAENSKKESELQKEDQELGKQRTVLSPDAFEQKLRDFREKVTNAQKEMSDKKRQLDHAYNTAVSEMQKTVVDIVGDLAKEKGFKVAIPTSELLYAESSMDITAEVLDRLNKKLPSMTVDFNAK